MKRCIYSILFFSLVFLCQAQNKGGMRAREFKHELKVLKASPHKTSSLTTLSRKYPVASKGNVAYVSIVAKVSENFDATELECNGVRVNSQVKGIVSMRVPIDKLDLLDACASVLHYDVARKVVPNCNQVRFDTGADSVQRGVGFDTPYTGKDVLIGITDWGFDYTHPNFYDTTCRKLRIYKAWDQFKLSGPAPDGFDYGTEYRTTEELKAAQCDTSGLYDYATHGSHVAGIAGGGGAGTKYRGVAPEAQYLFASFLLDEAAALDAFAWMKKQAEDAGKRLVVNMSWGMYSMGSMDGNSMLSQAIDAYSEQGVVFVSSAGNNGDVSFHISKTFTDTIDTLRTVADFHSSGVGQYITFWGEPYTTFEAGIGIKGTSIEMVRSPFFATSGSFILDTFLCVGVDTIPYRISVEEEDFYSHRPRWVVTIMKIKPEYKLHIFATATNQTLHGWNLVELENHAGNWGTVLSSKNIEGYTDGNPYYGVSEPAAARSCITVAAHIPDKTDGRTGAIAYFSSYGPILGDNPKPDISAPGMNICSSISSFTTEYYEPVKSVFFNRKGYIFSNMSGTSMSSPAVTGVVALILQSNPNLTPAQVKEIIIETARTDDKTGDLTDSVSVRWGHGKIDAREAIKRALELVSINPIASTESFLIYPNPAQNKIFIDYKEEGFVNISLYSIDGKCMLEKVNTMDKELNVGHLPKGVYLLKMQTKTDVLTKKLLITN